MNGGAAGMSLVKHLASCNQVLRERSLRLLLKTWLPAQTSIPDADLKKIWKGLFYCVWHADKAQFQAQLIDRLSAMLLVLDLPLSVQYFSVFLLTMRREWNGIDALRLDKFYLMIRRFVRSLFVLLKKHRWDSELTGRLIAVMDERTFRDVDQIKGTGVNYHIASVFIEELRPFLPVKLEIVEILLKPFIDAMKSSTDKILLGKIKSNLFELLLINGKNLVEAKKCGTDVDSGDNLMVYGTLALKMGFSGKFFELGSAPDCVQGNRKLLFGLHEEFLKLEKNMESSGIDVSNPEPENNVDDEEVPLLVPIDGVKVPDNATNGDAGKTLKKCKKLKKVLGVKKDEKKQKTKKEKKNKKKVDVIAASVLVDKENSVAIQLSHNDPLEDVNGGSAALVLDESIMSNLQLQFEKVAAEEGLGDVPESCDSLEAPMNANVVQKRKRVKSTKGQKSQDLKTEDNGVSVVLASAKSGEKSVKKVSFSMTNNLVWKPHTPLPPQSLRIPPSVTPRGSALKKGLSPGPIKESSSSLKKKQRARAVKKIKKKPVKAVSPAVKRLKKLKTSSP